MSNELPGPDPLLMVSSFDRRRFLAGAAGGIAALSALESRLQAGESPHAPGGFGPLNPVQDETTGLELLLLPEGFQYRSFGWTKDVMADGRPTPTGHDGMGVVADNDGVLTLIRNHELETVGRSMADPDQSYDPVAPGGCTALRFDTNKGEWVDSWTALSGTSRNCAGGVTPWGTWLSCEETTLGPGGEYRGRTYGYERDHGFVFEVPSEGIADPQPIPEMGRFWHEAAAVDVESGHVYLTEDRSTAGLYRFTPAVRSELRRGGTLQMLKATGRADLRKGLQAGDSFDVSWVDIDDPTRAHSPGTNDTLGVFLQGHQQGGATFGRLEGCDFRDGRVYVTATVGGDASAGQVWEYNPREERLTLLFESPGPEALDMPDNLAVSPRGGLILCEDGYHTPQRVHVLTADGLLFPLIASNVVLRGERNGLKGDRRSEEWAGACFSPDGRWLFVNNQTPGITFAVEGPWQDGVA